MCSCNFLRKSSILLVKFFMALLLNSTGHNINDCSYLPPINTSSSKWSLSQIQSSLEALVFDGHLDFKNMSHATSDFGNRFHFLPAAVLYPKSVSDISIIVNHIFQMGPNSELTVAARGHGHSLQGQSQAHQGIVINMESLTTPKMHIHTGKCPYVDASGGELWINILHETLKHGFAPKSWTDYLHLTVGGTLSNAGISGQTYRHGPQINNVHQLEVVTGHFASFFVSAGRGDVVVCSEKQNAELFYGVLGGLGQFGIITRARISIEPAPKRVKWMRVLYSDFYIFTKDQEYLISQEHSFDYIEGFVIINRTGLLNNWRSTFNPKDPLQADQFRSNGKTLYCLEIAKYFSPDDEEITNQMAEVLLSKLNYIQHTLFLTQVSYVEFLDRVHLSETKLREKGLWDVPHPWLSLLVPRSSIHKFGEAVFGNILTDSSNGPILVYPVNQSKWIKNTSMVTPLEDVFYLVGFLSSAMPSSSGWDELEHILSQNKQILDLCGQAKLGVKQYLPYYETQERWKDHFEQKWEAFARRKSMYDPLRMLAPGQRIFHKANNILVQQHVQDG